MAAISCILVLAASCDPHTPSSAARLTAAVREPTPEPVAEPAPPPPPSSRPPLGDASADAMPIHVEEIPIANDVPAFVVRGTHEHRVQMLFLAGMCVNPAGYLESFQRTAASRGDLLALQGDVSCGGDGAARRWSADLDAMDRRIDAAFQATGIGEPRDVVVIGYSQGADRAERLVSRWPQKYSRAILIGIPAPPSPRRLAHAHGVVLMAGTYDMAIGAHKTAVAPLRRASIPSTFIELPGARHGEMGQDPEGTMAAALDFVDLGWLVGAPE